MYFKVELTRSCAVTSDFVKRYIGNVEDFRKFTILSTKNLGNSKIFYDKVTTNS